MKKSYSISELINLADVQRLLDFAWNEMFVPARLEDEKGALLTNPAPASGLPAALNLCPAAQHTPAVLSGVQLDFFSLATATLVRIPILVGEEALAHLTLGEFLLDDEAATEAELEELARWMGLPLAECRRTLADLPCFPRASMERFLTHYCWQVGFIASLVRQSLDLHRQIEEHSLLTRALAEAEQRYRAIFHGIEDAVLIEALDGRILDANDPACRMFGYKQEELLRLEVRDLIAPGAAIANIKKRFNLGSPLESHGLCQDGGIFAIELSSHPETVDGQTVALVVVRDISARKQSEEAARHAQERLELALEATDAGLWDWDIPSGSLYISPQWYALLGFEANLLPSTYDVWQRLIHPEDVMRVNYLLEQHLTRRRPVYEAEFRIRANDGGWRWLLSRGRIIAYSPDGKPLRMAGTHIDITVRKAAETALRASEEKFYKSFQTSPDAILISRRSDSTILDVNNGFSRMTGFNRADVLGRPDVEVNFWQNPEDRRQMLRELGEKNEVLGMEATFNRKDHSQLTGLLAARLVDLEGSECILTIIRDISERKRSEDLLRDAKLRLEWAYEATLLGWNRALEMHDIGTRRHSERCIDLTVRLAEAAGIQGEDLTFVKYGAILHDIGKLAIPEDIINKPGPLNNEEWSLVQRHPLYAQEMLQGIEYLQPALPLITSHHERWDGNGYPLGLEREEIPLTARIFAIVDVWDSIIYPRPWRTGLGEEEARRYIHENSGLHFDPALVKLFFGIVGE